MYITLKPCPMCSSAIKQSRIKKIYYILDNDWNSISDNILENTDINQKVVVEKVTEQQKYQQIIQTFFKNQRK